MPSDQSPGFPRLSPRVTIFNQSQYLTNGSESFYPRIAQTIDWIRQRRRGTSLCFVFCLGACIEIVFETQVLHAAAAAPYELQSLNPDLDMHMPFDVVRGGTSY